MFLVNRRDQEPEELFRAGDIVDVFELDETISEAQVIGDGSDSEGTCIDESAQRRLARELVADETRVIGRWGCSCTAKGRRNPLVTMYAWRGASWVVVEGFRIPKAHQGDTAPLFAAPMAIPLHTEANGRPHTSMTSCRTCLSYWVILVTRSGFAVHRALSARFGVSVQE
jgi:hypothetical protein